MTFTVPEKYHQKPLLSFLTEGLGLSVTLIRRLKHHPQGITLDGESVTVRHVLRAGSTLHLAIHQLAQRQKSNILPMPSPLPLRILREDEDITLCVKPAGMPTHPSHGHFSDTLANALAHRALTNAPEQPFAFHPITRLDRNTSGVVLVARHTLAAARLTEAMMAGEIEKTYLALLCGRPSLPEGEIVTGIRRRQESIITREVTAPEDERADLARTQFFTVATLPSPFPAYDVLTLVQAHPLTGRTHQLRLHFAHLGAPILGDDMYGHGIEEGVMERHALHCFTLSFPHPRNREKLQFCAQLPDDMRALLPQSLAHQYSQDAF